MSSVVLSPRRRPVTGRRLRRVCHQCSPATTVAGGGGGADTVRSVIDGVRQRLFQRDSSSASSAGSPGGPRSLESLGHRDSAASLYSNKSGGRAHGRRRLPAHVPAVTSFIFEAWERSRPFLVRNLFVYVCIR